MGKKTKRTLVGYLRKTEQITNFFSEGSISKPAFAMSAFNTENICEHGEWSISAATCVLSGSSGRV